MSGRGCGVSRLCPEPSPRSVPIPALTQAANPSPGAESRARGSGAGAVPPAVTWVPHFGRSQPLTHALLSKPPGMCPGVLAPPVSSPPRCRRAPAPPAEAQPQRCLPGAWPPASAGLSCAAGRGDASHAGRAPRQSPGSLQAAPRPRASRGPVLGQRKTPGPPVPRLQRRARSPRGAPCGSFTWNRAELPSPLLSSHLGGFSTALPRGGRGALAGSEPWCPSGHPRRRAALLGTRDRPAGWRGSATSTGLVPTPAGPGRLSWPGSGSS